MLEPPGKSVCCVVDAFERGEDVLNVVAGDAVEVKEGGVEFGHQFGPLGFIPLVEPAAVFRLETAAGEVAGVGQRQHVFGRAGELEHPLADPRFQRRAAVPRARFVVGVGRQRRNLFDDEEVEGHAANFLAQCNSRRRMR